MIYSGFITGTILEESHGKRVGGGVWELFERNDRHVKGGILGVSVGGLGCCHGHLRSILNHRKQERGGNYYYYMTAYTWFSAYYYPSRWTGFIGIIFIDMGLRGMVYRDFCNPGKSC